MGWNDKEESGVCMKETWTLHEAKVDVAWSKKKGGAVAERVWGFPFRARHGFRWVRGNFGRGPFGLPNMAVECWARANCDFLFYFDKLQPHYAFDTCLFPSLA